MSEWQDISTAPKRKDDEILIWTPDGQYIATWLTPSSMLTSHTGWHVYDGYEWHVIQGHPATHWMKAPNDPPASPSPSS
jgi:hypothetical protein